MNIDKNQALDFLFRLGSHPVVSFYEKTVLSEIELILDEIGIQYCYDGFGNIIATFIGQNDKECPPIAFVAHTDHPGFEAVSKLDNGSIEAIVHGGVPQCSFTQGVSLQIINPDGTRVRAETRGRIESAAQRTILVEPITDEPFDVLCPIVFDLTDFDTDDDFIYMRALDDLAGCASILAMLSHLRNNGHCGIVQGVFTRAEEVGLVGARLIAESDILSRDTLIVSLESSRVLPGAEQGKGPVIRTGDAAFTFSVEAEAILVKAKEEIQKKDPNFRVQRQLMSGGTCEASAFLLYGYMATGIAFPLGNYHNGTEDGQIGAEFIHKDDYFSGIQLMVESALNAKYRQQTQFRTRLQVVDDHHRARLQNG